MTTNTVKHTPDATDTREWQPAETAPRDGSEFIACNRGFAPFSCQFWRGEFVHFEPEDGPIYYSFELWQSLPAPAPQEKGRG